MINEEQIIQQASKASGISEADLNAFFAEGEKKEYQATEWLFHESTPREWAGIILDGDVELVRGLHGSSRHVGSLIAGTLLSEGAFLGDDPHSTGASTRHGATVWQISKEKIAAYREAKPDLFYRIVARVAVGISRRMGKLSDQIFSGDKEVSVDTGFRLEHDSLGQRQVPAQVYYGIQTQRAMENFSISGISVSNFDHFVSGLAMTKKAAAQANTELGALDKDKADAICAVCDELLDGKLHENFTVDMFQGGAGTSTNMNANEVIANRGLELMGYNKGEYEHLHPNDHVNRAQSTNDAYPTSIKLATLLSHRDLARAMGELKKALEVKAEEFSDVLKMGRTENQDAVPMTLGQEFSAYSVMVGSAMAAIEGAANEFHAINMGATAIGTGINSPPGYANLVTKKLSEVSGFDLHRAGNLVEATQNAGIFVQMSATLKRAAVQISKICNDLRWLSSGPVVVLMRSICHRCSRDHRSCRARSIPQFLRWSTRSASR